MNTLIFVAGFFLSVHSHAADQVYRLDCWLKVGQGRVEVSYSAPFSKMELTKAEEGSEFGSSYGGELILKLNGRELIRQAADAAAEEYGVIIENGQLIYAALDVEDEELRFSNEPSFYLSFGRSFDDLSPGYTTGSSWKSIGGGKSPRTYSASCQSQP